MTRRHPFHVFLSALLLLVGACNKPAVDPTPPPPDPTLTATPARLAAFGARVGEASAAQSFTVSGTDLRSSISATAPVGFELALDPTAAYAASVSVTPVAQGVAAVYVRLAATSAAGTVSGEVVLSSPGAAEQRVAASGLVSVAPPPPAVLPTLAGFQPARGPVGTLVTITGTNLSGATAVTWNGVALPDFTVASAAVLTATIPANAPTDQGQLTVTTPVGKATSTATFEVTPPAPATLRTGTMTGQGGIASTGMLTIERDAAGMEAVRFAANFRTDFHTGSLGVYLAKSNAAIRSQRAADASNVVRVGTITRDGAQTLPITGSSADYPYLIIHCDPAQINFGAALLQ